MFTIIRTAKLRELHQQLDGVRSVSEKKSIQLKEMELYVEDLRQAKQQAEKRTVLQQDEYEKKIKEFRADTEQLRADKQRLKDQNDSLKSFNEELGAQVNDEVTTRRQYEEEAKKLRESNNRLILENGNLVTDLEGQKSARIQAEEAYEKLQAEFSKYKSQNPVKRGYQKRK